MRKTFFMLIISALFAFLGIGLLKYKEYYTEHLVKNNDVYINFLQLNKTLAKLESEVFKANYYLYIDNDGIIKNIKDIDSLIKKIKDSKHFNSKEHRAAYLKFSTFINKYKKYKEDLYRFLTYNATVKNSVVYIPALTLRSFSILDTKKEINLIIFLNKIASEIFIAKNAKDYSFIKDLKEYAKELKLILNKKDEEKKKLLMTFEKHLNIFINYFPKSIKLMEKLSSSSLDKTLQDTIDSFQKSTKNELRDIKFYDRFFTALYILSILIIIYFIFYTANRNKQLKKMLITDSLTGLKNRFAFKQDKKMFKNPTLLLINIDRFKDINEFYGNSFGDRVLIEFSKKVMLTAKEILNNHKHYCYRFGSDNFGVMFEKNSQDLIKTAKIFLEEIDDLKIDIDNIEVDISVSIGISSHKEKLFESAEMALKRAKEDRSKKFYIYSEKIDKTKEIAKNLNQIRELKSAIEEDRLIPFYQPIFDINTNKVVKYEALARIIKKDDRVILPKDFLDVVKVSKLSSKITTTILKKAIDKIKREKKHFSVNISYEDIENKDDRDEILKIIKDNKEVAKYLTLEILESVEIENYEIYEGFIKEIKDLGCSVAMDDFGSGYSNFDRVLKLNIDSLKIDGSLIKDIDKNEKNYLIVSTIVDFAKKAGIVTVAEFVNSKEVLDRVKKLGIDRAQGFFLGKPSPDIL